MLPRAQNKGNFKLFQKFIVLQNYIPIGIFSFWNQVDPKLIDQLDQSWSYKTDFEMFEYNVEEYLLQIGVNQAQNETSSSSSTSESAS